MLATAFICLGSNVGDRFVNLFDAAGLVINHGVRRNVSSVYKTKPVGYLDQPDFLNFVMEIQTDLRPEELLREMKAIEKLMGREETFRYGPRIIDLDIVMFGSEIINTPELTVPHPRMHERRFVLVPMVEIAPELKHPVLYKTMKELLNNTEDGGEVEVWGKIMLGR